MRLGPLLSLVLRLGGSVAFAAAGAPQWPALPRSGFIAGRPATLQDVADGNAVFSTGKDGKEVGIPLPIQIPQYAYWDDGQGHKVQVIVVQAELANGIEIIGLHKANGDHLVCTRPELTLLGQAHP